MLPWLLERHRASLHTLPSLLQYFDEGDGSRSNYGAFLSYWLFWYVLSSDLGDGLDLYLFCCPFCSKGGAVPVGSNVPRFLINMVGLVYGNVVRAGGGVHGGNTRGFMFPPDVPV